MRVFILVASIIIQVCLGGLYAWSAFVPALCKGYSLTVVQTQLIFGAMIAVFTVVTVLAGRMLERYGPRFVGIVGGILFGAGYLTASVSGGSFAVLLVGMSVMAGAGTGFGYICPLTTCVKWFPRHKGLVTGVAVAGFGAGAILLSALAESLFSHAVDVLVAFRWIGISYGILITGSSLALVVPQSERTVRASRPPLVLATLMRDRIFWSLVIGMLCGTFGGLLVIGNLKPIALSVGLSSAVAVSAISAFAVGNTVGRIAWGWITDKLGAKAVILSLVTLAASLCCLASTSIPAGVFILLSALLGFGFGGHFVIYPVRVVSRYGQDRLGSVYPLVFLSYGVAGITGPGIGGWLYDATGSYATAATTSVAVILSGLLLIGMLSRSASRLMPVAGAERLRFGNPNPQAGVPVPATRTDTEAFIGDTADGTQTQDEARQ